MHSLNKLLVNSVQCFVIVLLYSVIEYTKMYSGNLNDVVSKLTSAKLSLDNLTDNCNYTTLDLIGSLTNNNSELRILEWNIQGLLGKQDQIKSLLNKTITPDAVLVCETWLKSKTIDKFKLPNFKGYHRTRSNRIGGGVSILVNSKLCSRERKDLVVDTELLEHIIVELKCDRRNILLVSCCRPPNTNVNKFLREYKSLVKMLKAQKGYKVRIGLDHNLDLLKYHISPSTNDFLEFNLDTALLPCIAMPTRVTDKSATLIDNLFISRKLQYNYEPYIILDDLSDHLACLLILRGQNKSKKGNEKKVIKNLSSERIACINNKLSEVNWEDALNGLSTEESFSYFHNKLTQTLDKVSPDKMVTVSKKHTPTDPWMTKGILKSLTRQKSLYLEQIRHKTEASTNKYRTYRNRLKKLIHISKQTYFMNKCKAFKQDSRKLWHLINTTLNNKEAKDDGIESLRINGIPRYDANSITTEFCNHFTKIGKIYANKLPVPNTSVEAYIDKIKRSEHSLFLTPTDTSEINKLIKELPTKTSSGYDSISNTLLKSLSHTILKPLELIFNR